MNRRTLRYVANLLLLLSAVAVGITGLVVDRLDLHDFTPHRWSGYALVVLATLHVAMHWRWLLPGKALGQRASQRAGVPMTSPGQSSAPPPPPQTLPPHTDDLARSTSDGTRPLPSRRSALVVAGAGAAGIALGWTARTAAAPNPYPGGDVGLFYHRESSLGVRGLLGDLLEWGRRPAPYKEIADATPVALPRVSSPPEMAVAEALVRRRSRRSFADRELTLEELAWVVSAATAVTAGGGRRTAPSAGALYPIEAYVAVDRVTGVDAGLYHVDVRNQALELVRAGSVAGDLLLAGLGQSFLREAPVVLVLTGIFQRSRWKYRQRHYRYVCWEGGHIAQNVYLAAEAADLGACMVGAFLDDSLNDLLRVDGRQEAALGLIALGAQ